ncbi:MAG: type II toxin-antitoxin system VapB family antitoxin [Spirochaetaceae bacterium]|nr:type II toxin-antitoxin system VapB family antitoxin [Spirochaetaceae bacterium]
MPLNIKDPRTHQAARELAELTGTSITAAVSRAVAEALDREHAATKTDVELLVKALDDIGVHCAGLPLLDQRPADEILGYDISGLPQ